MFCKNCGTNLNENASFCPNCGTPLKIQQSYNGSAGTQPVQNKTEVSSELVKLAFIILVLGAILIFSAFQMFKCKVYSCSRNEDIAMTDIMESIDDDGVNIFPLNMNDDNEMIAAGVSGAIIFVNVIAGILAVFAVFGIVAGKRKKSVKRLSFAILFQFIGFAAVSFLAIFVVQYLDGHFDPEIGFFPMVMTVVDLIIGIAGLVTSKHFSND